MKIIRLLLLVAVFYLSSFCSVAAEETDFTFGIEFIMEDNEYHTSTQWWLPQSDQYGVYYLSIPYDAKKTELRADFTSTESIRINGTVINDGDIIQNLKFGSENILMYQDNTYVFVPLVGSDIPQIFIVTEEQLGLISKEEEVSGKIVIINSDGTFEYDGELDSIKGRGNSTWTLYPKKPFNIKLGEKADLFGLGKSKKYSLLANYIDNSLIKNKIVCDLANNAGINFSSKSQIVDLYMNGTYFGNYTLIERVEVGTNRVDIYNLEEMNEEMNVHVNPEDAPLEGDRSAEAGYTPGSYKYSKLDNNPEDISGGYLLEYELAVRYKDEASGFVSNYGQPIILKSPEYASLEQVEYIRGYYQEFEDAVLNDDGKNSLGKHYSEYIDIDSMATMYVLQEYVKNLDAGITSFYLYKDVGGKLIAAPVWDFDSALGREFTRFDRNLSNPYGMYATDLAMDYANDEKKSIIALLCKHSEFRKLAAQKWEQIVEPLMDDFVSGIEQLTNELQDSAVMDKTRWNQKSVESDLVNLDSKKIEEFYTQSVNELINFVTLRRQYSDDLFDAENCYIHYCANGGLYEMYDYFFYKKGETIVLRYSDFVSEDDSYRFDGWNTEADGSGISYQPEDTIVIEESIKLYAQWKKKGLVTRILEFINKLIKG